MGLGGRTGVIAAAVAVGIVLGSCDKDQDTLRVGTAAPTTTDDIVPWVDRPATPPTPRADPTPPPERFDACRADQLRASDGGTGAATGNIATTVTLTNISTEPCTLSGFPTRVIGITPDGHQEVLNVEHGGFFEDGTAWPANLQPGERGATIIGTGGGCNTAQDPQRRIPYVGVILDVPGGGEVRADARFDTVCGVSISKLGSPRMPPRDPHAYPGLALTVDRPDTAVAGTTLHFTVTLTNTTDHPVALSPCPVYTEGGYVPAGGSYAHTYELNCNNVTSIDADRHVTYAMQLPLPDVTGTAKFAWWIPTEANLFSGGILSLTQPNG